MQGRGKMKFWNKIKKIFQGPICIKCHKNSAASGLLYHFCVDCGIDNLCAIQTYETEKRINEMAEAIRRASPVAVKDVSNG